VAPQNKFEFLNLSFVNSAFERQSKNNSCLSIASITSKHTLFGKTKLYSFRLKIIFNTVNYLLIKIIITWSL